MSTLEKATALEPKLKANGELYLGGSEPGPEDVKAFNDLLGANNHALHRWTKHMASFTEIERGAWEASPGTLLSDKKKSHRADCLWQTGHCEVKADYQTDKTVVVLFDDLVKTKGKCELEEQLAAGEPATPMICTKFEMCKSSGNSCKKNKDCPNLHRKTVEAQVLFERKGTGKAFAVGEEVHLFVAEKPETEAAKSLRESVQVTQTAKAVKKQSNTEEKQGTKKQGNTEEPTTLETRGTEEVVDGAPIIAIDPIGTKVVDDAFRVRVEDLTREEVKQHKLPQGSVQYQKVTLEVFTPLIWGDVIATKESDQCILTKDECMQAAAAVKASYSGTQRTAMLWPQRLETLFTLDHSGKAKPCIVVKSYFLVESQSGVPIKVKYQLPPPAFAGSVTGDGSASVAGGGAKLTSPTSTFVPVVDVTHPLRDYKHAYHQYLLFGVLTGGESRVIDDWVLDSEASSDSEAKKKDQAPASVVEDFELCTTHATVEWHIDRATADQMIAAEHKGNPLQGSLKLANLLADFLCTPDNDLAKMLPFSGARLAEDIELVDQRMGRVKIEVPRIRGVSRAAVIVDGFVNLVKNATMRALKSHLSAEDKQRVYLGPLPGVAITKEQFDDLRKIWEVNFKKDTPYTTQPYNHNCVAKCWESRNLGIHTLLGIRDQKREHTLASWEEGSIAVEEEEEKKKTQDRSLSDAEKAKAALQKLEEDFVAEMYAPCFYTTSKVLVIKTEKAKIHFRHLDTKGETGELEVPAAEAQQFQEHQLAVLITPSSGAGGRLLKATTPYSEWTTESVRDLLGVKLELSVSVLQSAQAQTAGGSTFQPPAATGDHGN